MPYIYFIIIILLFPLNANCGNNEMLVICTYDYKQALQNEGATTLPTDSTTIPYFLKATVADSTYDIEPLHSCFDGCRNIFDNDKNILIYVHGFGTDFNSLILNAKTIIDLYDVNLILFVWPANEKKRNIIRDYKESKKSAKFLQNIFFETMYDVTQHNTKRNVNVSIIFHSLGNVYAELLSQKIAQLKDNNILFDNIILNAASVPAKKHNQWVDELKTITKKDVYVIYNKNDKVLKTVWFFVEQKRILGQKPLAPRAKTARYINFSTALKDEKHYATSHTYFIYKAPFESANICNFYYTILNGNQISFADQQTFIADRSKKSVSIRY